MVKKFVSENLYVGIIASLLRVYFGWTFLHAAIEKYSNGFDASGYLTAVIKNPVMVAHSNPPVEQYGWLVSFLQNFALPHAGLFNTIVPLGELLIGLGLILGCLTKPAAFFAGVMVYTFLMAGTVSSIAYDTLLMIMVFYTAPNSYRFGLDRWVSPYLHTHVFNKFQKKTVSETL